MLDQFFRRSVRLFSLLVILMCEACSMKQQHLKKESLSPLTPQIQYKIPAQDVRHEVLENGMNILVMKNNVIPKVLVQIAYDIGSAVEESGETGLAHYLEHMIFKGTNLLKEGDIDSIARKYGATFNAFTSKDMTSYFFEVDKNNWNVFLPILADCMQNARFDENHMASELLAVVQELKMYKDKYWRRMIEKASEMIYPANHPYHCPIIGFKEDLAVMNSQKLRAFYEKYYQPERATLLILGDVDLDDAIAKARAQFSSIPAKKSAPGRSFPIMLPELTTHKSTIYEAVQKPQLGFYWLIPGIKNSSVEMLSMLVYALGGGEGSRLYRTLVDEMQIADSVSVDSYQLMESGLFLVLIEPKNGSIDQCRSVVVKTIEEVMRKGITKEEQEKTIVNESSNFFQMLTDLQNFSYEWLTSFYATQDPLGIFKKIEALNEVKKEEVQAFAQEYLDPFLMNQMTLLPIPEDKKEIWQKAKEASDLVDKELLAAHVRQTPVEEPEYVNTLSSPAPLSFVFPKPSKSIEMKNGLQVLLYQRSQIPLVSLQFVFKNTHALSNTLEGVRLECLMSMLIEGSKKYSKETLVSYFEQAGAEYGFSVGGSSLSCFNDHYKDLFSIFFHILREPDFSKEAFEKVKAQMVESYVRAQDSHVSVGRKALKNALYGKHSYAWTFDEAIESVKSMTIDDLKVLHQLFVRPEQVVVGVAGDFELEAMEKVLNELFEQWGKGQERLQIEVVTENADESYDPDQNIDIPMLRDQAILLLGQPSPLNLYHPDYVPVKILNFICFNSLGSRLYALREQTGLFYNAQGAFAAGCDKEKGYDFVMAILNPENVASAEEKLKQVLKTFCDKGITQDELDAARQLYLKGLIDVTVQSSDVASMLCSLSILGLPFDYYDNVLKRVQSITVEELNAIAKKYFDPSKMMRVRVGRV